MTTPGVNSINSALARNRTTTTVKAGGTSTATNNLPIAGLPAFDGNSSNNLNSMLTNAYATGLGLGQVSGVAGLQEVRNFGKLVNVRLGDENASRVYGDGINQKLFDYGINTTGLIQSRTGKYYNASGVQVTPAVSSGLYVVNTNRGNDRAAMPGRQASGYIYYKSGANFITKGLPTPTQ